MMMPFLYEMISMECDLTERVSETYPFLVHAENSDAKLSGAQSLSMENEDPHMLYRCVFSAENKGKRIL